MHHIIQAELMIDSGCDEPRVRIQQTELCHDATAGQWALFKTQSRVTPTGEHSILHCRYLYCLSFVTLTRPVAVRMMASSSPLVFQ